MRILPKINNFALRRCRKSCVNVVVFVCGFQLVLIVFLYSGLNLDNNRTVGQRLNSGIQKATVNSSEVQNMTRTDRGMVQNRTKKFTADVEKEAFKELNKTHRDQPLEIKIPPQENHQVRKDDADKKMPGAGINASVARFTDPSEVLYAGEFLQTSLGCFGQQVHDQFTFYLLRPNFYVFSVFWDQRVNDFDNIGGGVKLRIMSIATKTDYKRKAPVFCHFFHNDGNYTVEASYYEMCENHGKQNGGYILTCDVPHQVHELALEEALPLCSVHISADPDDPGRAFKVYTTEPQERRVDFSVCVSPLFGKVPIPSLVEWLELQHVLGVRHVVFYNYNASKEAASILRTYTKAGRVSIIPWPMPIQNDRLIWYHGQLIAMMDCLFRNMATSNHVIMNDIDEFIIPQQDADLASLLVRLGDTPETCGYQFNSAFFEEPPRTGAEPAPDSKALFSIARTKRTEKISTIRTKCLLKPYLLFEAGIHHISKPILASLQSGRVSLPDALIHHYRKCQTNYGMKCKNFVDDYVVKQNFSSQLLARYEVARKLLKF